MDKAAMKAKLCRWFGHPLHDRYSVDYADGGFIAACGRCGALTSRYPERQYIEDDGSDLHPALAEHLRLKGWPPPEDVPTDVLPEDHQDRPFGWWFPDFDGPES